MARLITHSADVSAVNDAGRTPLHYAVDESPWMVKFLLKLGAEVDICDHNGQSALHILCSKPSSQNTSKTSVKKAVLDLSKISQLSGARGSAAWIPITTRLEGGYESGQTTKHTTKLLLNAGAFPMVKDVCGQNPLHLACLEGNVLEAGELLNLHLSDDDGTSPEQVPVNWDIINVKDAAGFALMEYALQSKYGTYRNYTGRQTTAGRGTPH